MDLGSPCSSRHNRTSDARYPVSEKPRYYKLRYSTLSQKNWAFLESRYIRNKSFNPDLEVGPFFLTRPNPTHCSSDPTWPDSRPKWHSGLDSTRTITPQFFLISQNIAKFQLCKELYFIATQHILNNGPDPARPMHVWKFCDSTQPTRPDPWMDPAHFQLWFNH